MPYTIVEKVLLLQNVDLLSEARTDDLAVLASIADEIRPDYVYIAGNVMYNNLEDCVDIKEADDIIISGNICHSFNRALSNNLP